MHDYLSSEFGVEDIFVTIEEGEGEHKVGFDASSVVGTLHMRRLLLTIAAVIAETLHLWVIEEGSKEAAYAAVLNDAEVRTCAQAIAASYGMTEKEGTDKIIDDVYEITYDIVGKHQLQIYTVAMFLLKLRRLNWYSLRQVLDLSKTRVIKIVRLRVQVSEECSIYPFPIHTEATSLDSIIEEMRKIDV